ncbi:MAG TPA: ribokinase [Parvularcula sp.]|nr:ribokinase [Parvularcula sp.]
MKRIAVVGSVNLDIVAAAPKLPLPGETVSGARLGRYPGGKGANQALAARRLGADVRLHACVGADAAADEALSLLQADGVELSAVAVSETEPTGVALIAVAPDGENQIVVAPGANAAFTPDRYSPSPADAVICQLEIPIETVAKAALSATFFCLNAAPALALPLELLKRAALIVVNETEAAAYGEALWAGGRLVAVTRGAKGASIFRAGKEIAHARPPKVRAIDATGAGDAFVAALTLALVEGKTPDDALAFAVSAGALAVTKRGAQPSLPWRADVEKLLSR